MPDTFELASKGDITAQRKLIKDYVAYQDDDRCSKRSALEHALLIARMALINGAEREDREAFLHVLALCIGAADESGDDGMRLSYAGELVGQIDSLIDAGDEEAGVWLATALPTIDPQVLEIARTLQKIWAENAAIEVNAVR